MLFGETVAVYCETHTAHINTLCGQNAEILDDKTGGKYSYQLPNSMKKSLHSEANGCSPREQIQTIL
jgi:hypothetical protein